MEIDEMKKQRVAYNQKLKDADDFFTRFGALDDEVYAAGAIDKKHKELMGLAISIATRCRECVCYHMEGCLRAGAGKAEIMEAVKIGVIGGGSITWPEARFAMQALESMLTQN